MAGKARLRLGMVGGGLGAFIGEVHRMAARLDGRYELVAGAFSSDSERSRRSGQELGLSSERSYPTFETMLAGERVRDDGVEVVSIVTPNHLHFAPAKAFLEAGIHVICDKPMTATLEEARELAEAARQASAGFFLTHTYSGYPMVRQARQMVAEGRLGNIRVVQVEYAQDWLATSVEETGNKQAGWRVDPEKAGGGGAIGDIGTHAYHLAGYVSGMRPNALFAELTAFGKGRRLDDNAGMLLRYPSGARGMLWASQVAAGSENGLRLRLYGDKAGLEWCQEEPNSLWFTPLGEPRQRLTRGGPGIGQAAAAATRVPSGHPEGYIEAFANLYSDFADAMVGTAEGKALPGASEGLEGLLFIEAALRSAEAGSFVEIGAAA